MPMQMTQALLPTLSQIAQYQSPKEQLAQKVMEQQTLQAMAPTKIDLTKMSAGEGLFDPNTGQWIVRPSPKTDMTLTDILSPSEAQALGVSYGTTKGQAAQMGIIPEEQKSIADAAKAKSSILNANEAIQNFQKAVNNMKLSVNKPTARISGPLGTLWDKLGFGTKPISEFEAARELAKNTISDAASSTARGKKYSIEAIDKALPKRSDSRAEASNKMMMLYDMLTDITKSYRSTYGTTAKSGGGGIVMRTSGGNTFEVK